MKLSKAFSERVRDILYEKKMTQYRLEQLTGIYHSSMTCILNNKYKSANFKNMSLIIRALGYTYKDFFDSPLFNFDDLDIDE